MRISTAFQYESYAKDIAAASERYSAAQTRVTTGKTYQKPSEDWVGAAASLNYKTLKSTIEQYRKNLTQAKAFTGFTEGALTEGSTLLQRAYELAVRGANGVTDQAGRNTMADELQQIQNQLVEFGNSRGADGQYLFAGQKTDTKPFTIGATGISFNGDNNSILAETGPGQTLAVNTPGGTMVVDAYNALESLKSNLQGGNVGAISGVDLPAIQGSLAAFRQARGAVGSKLQAIERTDLQHARRLDEFTARISDVEDVDLSDAILQLRLSETAYQAALSTAGQGFRLSLVDFING